jgi:hypothetical protein
MSFKSTELIISEGVQLVKDLERALARERGGGTPLSRKAYLALRETALMYVRQNEKSEVSDG